MVRLIMMGMSIFKVTFLGSQAQRMQLKMIELPPKVGHFCHLSLYVLRSTILSTSMSPSSLPQYDVMKC